jgi:hypothetical protein
VREQISMRLAVDRPLHDLSLTLSLDKERGFKRAYIVHA